MKIVCISDIHLQRPEIPECDLLIDAGDWTGRGDLKSVLSYFEWLKTLPAKHIVTVPGNHELVMERDLPLYLNEINQVISGTSIHLLIDQPAEVLGVKIYGSPQTPYFNNWAFNRNRGEDIKRFWDAIPDDTQILVTHGPPEGILDHVPGKGPVGCADLFSRVRELKDLKLHVFGHIHSDPGTCQSEFGPLFVNAAQLNDRYEMVNLPIELELLNGKVRKC